MTPAPAPPAPPAPAWARELAALYESGAASQFVLHGNTHDIFFLPTAGGLGGLSDYLLSTLLAGFEVVLTYDPGHGLQVARGGTVFSRWPSQGDAPKLPREPDAAIAAVSHHLRYAANLRALGQSAPSIACVVRDADLLLPNTGGHAGFELNASAWLVKEWGADPRLAEAPQATFLLVDNLNDLHPLLSGNTRAGRIEIPLPDASTLAEAFRAWAPRFPKALEAYRDQPEGAARQLVGATLASVEGLLKLQEKKGQPLAPATLAAHKKALVEKDCQGLVEFIESRRTLDDLAGMDRIKAWVRQDIALWHAHDIDALPKGYLLCGPVGTGKTFLVECLAGEAGVPVVKLRNFRDKWVGSTEGNLEKIFRLLGALGKCIVFIDEADQTLGRRDSGSNDSGLGGRVYSMIAQEMSKPENRGRILWVLASSRPDLIEVDLKRPGRVDVKIPIFPTVSAEESFALLAALCKRRGLVFAEGDFTRLRGQLPLLLTPGAADALATKLYRDVRTVGGSLVEVAEATLAEYRPPVDPAVLAAQIRLAIAEASDRSFIPREVAEQFGA
jgi:hypothetical protein